jgi:hypothetical protein
MNKRFVGIISFRDSVWTIEVAGQRQYNIFNKEFHANPRLAYNIAAQCEVVCGDRKEEKNMRRMFGFLIGITVGGLVGSTIALLMAPESGEQLRTELRSRGEGFFNEVRHAADERRIELRQRLETMREPRMEG